MIIIEPFLRVSRNERIRSLEHDRDLRLTKQFQQVSSGRAALFPEDQPKAQVNVNVLNYEAIRAVERSE